MNYEPSFLGSSSLGNNAATNINKEDSATKYKAGWR